MNFILGSGIIGYLARRILKWPFIPFKKSRYYTFEVPWADDLIKYDDKIDDFMQQMASKHATKILIKQPYSFKGQLLYEHDITREIYLKKVYNDKIPNVAENLMKTTCTVYSLTAKMLHDGLFNEYKDVINSDISKYGELDKIDTNNHIMTFKEGKTVEYDNLISTIPLNALCKFCDIKINLESRSVFYYHIFSEIVNLEEAYQSFVCDLDIEFFKVQRVGENNYVFWTFNALDNPYQYFGMYIGYNMDLLEAKRISDVIPLGDPPDLDFLESLGIYCIGSNAQWDDFIDVATCIRKILRLAGDKFI